MSDKKSSKNKSIPSRSLARGFSASLASLRMGGAIALDGARQKLVGGDDGSEFAKREAKRFTDELGRLKGSYVKIGQMMALFGEHFLPPVLAQALHELEDNTQPVSWQELEPIVRAELGDSFGDLAIDSTPIAAASLAQVHRAQIIATGEEICLKIQYPNLAQMIDADFDALIRMMRAARWLKVGKDIDAWLAQMRTQLHNEIDYKREADITRSMLGTVVEYELDKACLVPHEASAQSAHIAAIRVPRVFDNFSSSKLLALDYCDGDSVKHENVLALPLEDRNALAVAMLRLFFYEVFEWGLMQADPNFGNYLIEYSEDGYVAGEGSVNNKREALSRCRLVLLDFGSSLAIEDGQRENLRRVINGGLARSDQDIEQGLKGLGWLSESANPEAVSLFIKFCHHLLEPLRPADEQDSSRLNAQGQYCWSASKLMERVGKKGLANAGTRHFELPAKDFSLFARKLTGVFTFIAYLGAEFNAYESIQDFLDND